MGIEINPTGWFWWQLLFAAVIVAVAVIYVRGWRRLHHHSNPLPPKAEKSASTRACILFFCALFLSTIVLLSPLSYLVTTYFSLHVVQNLLLVGWIPFLLVTADPIPALNAGLPSLQQGLDRAFKMWPVLRHILSRLLSPGAILITFVACVWLWYDPAIHQATLHKSGVRGLEIGSLLGVALLYWWHITGAFPRLHRSMPLFVRAGYALAGAAPLKLVGLVLIFMEKTIYHYPNSFRLSGLIIDDQGVGGIVIWVLGGVLFAANTFRFLRRWLTQEVQKPALPESVWATDEALLAPGLKRQNARRMWRESREANTP